MHNFESLKTDFRKIAANMGYDAVNHSNAVDFPFIISDVNPDGTFSPQKRLVHVSKSTNPPRKRFGVIWFCPDTDKVFRYSEGSSALPLEHTNTAELFDTA